MATDPVAPGVDPLGDAPLFDQSAKSLGGDGVLTPKDLGDFSKACQIILNKMWDGLWHTKDEMREWTGQDEAHRRMCSLRSHFIIEAKRRDPIGRIWLYRIVGRKPNAPQV